MVKKKKKETGGVLDILLVVFGIKSSEALQLSYLHFFVE